MDFDFSEIRCYNDGDYTEVVERLLKEPTIYRISRFLQEGISDEEVRVKLMSYDSVRDFQINFVLGVVKKLVTYSIDKLTSTGSEKLSNSREDKYTFISNHRNIVMDASLLNHELYETFHGDFESTAIAIGNNLLSIPWVKDLARLNKSFVVIRDSGVQQMLENSKVLSHYIRQYIRDRQSSVWIAQREGRTKDGNDFTQPGLLKMFLMSGSNDFVESFSELRLVPVAISYEFDPCICDKVKELSAIENAGEYVKEPMDDFNSMYNGMMGHKGRVHFSFGDEISAEVLRTIDPNIPRNEKIKKLAEHIDEFVYANYKLWPNNYIAADLLNGNTQFADFYNTEDKQRFEGYMDTKLGSVKGDDDQNKRILLTIFANPVKNAHLGSPKFAFNF